MIYNKRGGEMSTITPNLGLIRPSLTDEIHQTIIDLSDNFKKLDDVAEIYMSNPPTSGTWEISKKVYNVNPVSGSYIGWVNVRSGTAAPKWSVLTNYNVGDVIVPTIDNGHFYTCVQSGRSGTVEPIFPVSSESTVQDIQGATIWQPSKSYQLNEIVIPSMSNNRFYVCTVAGVSGTNEPVWSLVDGGTVSDGMVVWTGYRICTWKESGISALFRPFGKIE
jgi:hypothetical protein